MTNNDGFDYFDALDIIVQHYREVLLDDGAEEAVFDKASNIIRAAAGRYLEVHGIELNYPQIKLFHDGTLNILYYPVKGDLESFILLEVNSSERIKYMAKDTCGNTMSGIMNYTAMRYSPFGFFNI